MQMLENMSVPARASRGMDWYVRLGLVGTLCFIGGTVAWGMMAPLEGAVIAPGAIVVENNVTRVQHLNGGVVGEILVREGQRVVAGDVLVRLDETATRSAQQIVVNEMTAVRARLSRLRAERDQHNTLNMPQDLRNRAMSEPLVRQALDSELSLFEARARTRRGQRGQYEEQIAQIKQEITGTAAQFDSSRSQLGIAEIELSDMRGLLAKGLVQRPRVTQLEREVARIRGMLGELTARAAQLRAKITETELLILQVDQTLETEVAREIRENETKLNELGERLTAADDQLRRIDLRAPREGIIHQLQVHTVGGVIQAGAVIMNIVPERETLVIEARVSPNDIDQLYADQRARVRLTAFNTRTTPELQGHVYRIAADLTRDDRSNISYYTVGIRIGDDERAKLGNLRLIPGMPAESFIKTSERTIASFLVRPLLEHMNRAFREE
jgi:HlyD family secretion protein